MDDSLVSSSARIIYTIGHSTRPVDVFINLLRSFDIQVLCDIRRFPGSARFPHFNKEALRSTTALHGITYLHMEALGGRRKARKDSKNIAWKNESFRGYADYMETIAFEAAVTELQENASRERVGYMCSEAVWWRCHRALLSDYLKFRGWQVVHITGENKSQEHPYTKAAKVIKGHLDYFGEGDLLF